MRDSNRQSPPSLTSRHPENLSPEMPSLEHQTGTEEGLASQSSAPVVPRIYWMVVLAIALTGVALWIQPDFSDSGNGPAVGRGAPDIRLVDFRLEERFASNGLPTHRVSHANDVSVQRPRSTAADADPQDDVFAWRTFEFTDANVTLLHFWATWCSPCRREIPELFELHREFANDPNFHFIAVSCEGFDDASLTTLRNRTLKFYDSLGIRLPTYADPTTEVRRSVLRLMEQEKMAYPTTVLIDGNGIIQAAWVGVPPGGVDTIRSKVIPLLNSASEPAATRRLAPAD